MSVFSPIQLPGGGPGDARKKQLLQKLMQQYAAGAQRAAGLAHSGSMLGLGTAAHGGRPFGGGGLLTGALPNLAPGLAKLLGPGGVGHAIPGVEMSGAPGLAVGHFLGANPHASAPGLGSSGGTPIPTVPDAPGNPAAAALAAGNAAQGMPISPSSPAAVAASGNVPAGSGTPAGTITDPTTGVSYGPSTAVDGGIRERTAMPGNAATGSSNPNPTYGSALIPLGNGLFFDPVNGVTVRQSAPTTGGVGGAPGGTFSAI